MSEGTSVSYVASKGGASILDTAAFQEVLRNTSGHTTVAAIEQGKSRVVLHGGFTSLIQSPVDPQNPSITKVPDWTFNAPGSSTPQFFSNIACWTAGVN